MAIIWTGVDMFYSSNQIIYFSVNVITNYWFEVIFYGYVDTGDRESNETFGIY